MDRSPEDIPFSSTSVWNIGIGSLAQWGAPTIPDVMQLDSLDGMVNAGVFSQPIYFGTASDPLVTVTDTDPLEPVPPQQIHIPINAVPAAGTDGQMNFYDAAQPGLMWSYDNVKFNNGVDVTGGLTASLGGVWNTTGDGVTSAITPDSNNDFAVGTITDYDLSQGVIQHALRVAISVDALSSPGANWMANIPWPNFQEDFNGPQTYTGNIIAGSTFGIPAGINLDSLGLSPGGLMLATALQDYGAIWRDSGGTDQMTFYATPDNEDNPLITEMRDDLPTIMPLIDILRNQGPTSINGGGPSIVPALPPVSLSAPPLSASNSALPSDTGGALLAGLTNLVG